MEINTYNTISPKQGDEKNLNILPYFSFFYSSKYLYLNIGWLHVCFQVKFYDHRRILNTKEDIQIEINKTFGDEN